MSKPRFRPPCDLADYVMFAATAIAFAFTVHGALSGESGQLVAARILLVVLCLVLACDGPYSRLGRDIVQAMNEDQS